MWFKSSSFLSPSPREVYFPFPKSRASSVQLVELLRLHYLFGMRLCPVIFVYCDLVAVDLQRCVNVLGNWDTCVMNERPLNLNNAVGNTSLKREKKTCQIRTYMYVNKSYHNWTVY